MKRKHARHHSAPSRCCGAPHTATFTLAPETSAARILGRIADLGGPDEAMDSTTLAQLLESQGLTVAAGDLTCVRRSLAAQVTTLERMFHHFFDLACKQEPGSDSYGRLAALSLRAQTQSARTAAVLARLSQIPPPAPPPPSKAGTSGPDDVKDEEMVWLPPACGPDCVAHVALMRLTRWAARSPAAIASVTRVINRESQLVVPIRDTGRGPFNVVSSEGA